jgi:hypothetical protein
MSKYKKLVETADRELNLLNNLKARISRDFVQKLSLALDCEKDKIEVEFGRLKYSESNKFLTWDFVLSISLATSEGNINAPLDFSFFFIKDTEDVSCLSITYYIDKKANLPKVTMYKLDDPIEGLADIIFQEIEKKIKQCHLFAR